MLYTFNIGLGLGLGMRIWGSGSSGVSILFSSSTPKFDSSSVTWDQETT